VVGPGDQLVASLAFHVVNAFAERRDPPVGPWFVVVSGKVVSVSQNRFEPVLDVVPGRAARLLAPMARREQRHLRQAWAMQVAIDHSGLGAIVSAVLLGRALPSEAGVYPPRVGAVPPADAAVVRSPFRPSEVASSLVAALRLALPPEVGQSLAGVVVGSADERGSRVLGHADGPAAEFAPPPSTLMPLVLADNPAGQGTECTPILVVARQPVHTEIRRAPRDLAALDRQDVGQLASRPG
jgi:asparagine synthase (glutamine-hydrolysing)